ncbi:MAG: formate dehydrogenase accessory protein FdhE [Actinomycetota bacterium]|nr:formate dehydrogenase accessory protein FdhE [Actinomycetota bacterium]
MRGARGGPGDFGRRLQRASELAAASSAAQQPLSLLVTVLVHQVDRAGAPEVAAAAHRMTAGAALNRLTGRWPLLELQACVGQLEIEVHHAVDAITAEGAELPSALAEHGAELAAGLDSGGILQTWLDDPTLVDGRWAFWLGAAAAPLLEVAAAQVDVPGRNEWSGSACPICGGLPQTSAIAEESGEFMAGSPRYLICGRCATWWSWPRATCPACGQDDSRKLGSYNADGRSGVRIDACDLCGGYIKAFDLRVEGSGPVIPVVDDVATLTLDLWAHGQGLARPVLSMAGV